MLSSILQSKKQKGFTIIEVLIVLAIVGLIMLVVFLAVPALNRNAHNTQRNSDVASILGAVNEYVNNNNGSLPTTASVNVDGKLTISGGTGSNSTETNLGWYKSDGTTSPVSIATGTPGTTNGTTIDTVVIYKGAVCNSTATNASTSGASSRSIAAIYTLEKDAKQCKTS